MKMKHGFLFGFAVLLAAAIFSLTGCPSDNSPSGPNIPEELVGKWGLDTDSEYYLEIKSDGSGTYGNVPATRQNAEWDTDGDFLVLSLTAGGSTQEGKAKWTITSGKLTFSSPEGNLAGLFMPFITASSMGIDLKKK
jgi:hypothetical protein